jgi:Rieske [2Fe-2S] domain
MVIEAAGESLIVIRTSRLEIRAFYNVCRHRGMRLKEDSVAIFPRFNVPTMLPGDGVIPGCDRILRGHVPHSVTEHARTRIANGARRAFG